MTISVAGVIDAVFHVLTLWIVILIWAEVRNKRGEALARAEAAEKHIAFLRDALGDERQSVWRDVKLSAATEEAVSTVLKWRDRAEEAEKLCNEALQERDEVWEDKEFQQARAEAAEKRVRELEAARAEG